MGDAGRIDLRIDRTALLVVDVRGFDVLVVEDCVATFAEEYDLHEASLRNLSLLFAVVRESAALRTAAIA